MQTLAELSSAQHHPQAKSHFPTKMKASYIKRIKPGVLVYHITNKPSHMWPQTFFSMEANHDTKALKQASSTETIYVNDKGLRAHGITRFMTAFVLIITCPYA